MSYSGFLISNYATGFDREVQPWLLPNDAFVDLLDGFVYRGVATKRDGYSGFANGLPDAYTESRMVHKVTNVAPATGAINGANKTYTWTLTTPIARGSVTITGSNPAQVLVDVPGIGLTGTFSGPGTGTINYTTGAVSITFTAAPIALSTVLLTYSYHQGLPVMGIMSFYPTNNVRELIVADTDYVNKYNPTTQRLEDISPAAAYNGGATDFWSWVNYANSSSTPRLLFCNGVNGDVIQQWDGTTVTDYAPTFAGGTLNARQMFIVKDRLVLFQTIEGGTLFPRRIRISGTGVNCDVFNNTATGAGFIDIPDNTWFFGAAFNRDDVMFFTESSTWILKYTGNDVNPFSLEKIDGSRGCAAAFSVISYLNRTMAASPRGLIMSDGYQVERMDNNIPDFSFNDIKGSAFTSCYSGFLDEERDVYFLYPSQGTIRPELVPADSSDRILTINFEEDNYSIYRIPLSCVGNFQFSETVLWQDLTSVNGYPNWDSFADKYGNWISFPFSKSAPISLGGGHKGEVWTLNDTQNDDNPQMIRSVTDLGTGYTRITTDWNNYEVGDFIIFESVNGITGLDDKQFAITNIATNYTTFDIHTTVTGSYTGNGIASKVINFEANSKKFNPWIDSDKKVKCGWIYFYVSTATTDLIDDFGEVVPALLQIEVATSNHQVDTNTMFNYVVDCSLAPNETGDKKWVKIWINQVGQFLQFRMRNNQAGAKIRVHAMMPGFQPVGRLV